MIIKSFPIKHIVHDTSILMDSIAISVLFVFIWRSQLNILDNIPNGSLAALVLLFADRTTLQINNAFWSVF